jgi:uncharacterized protein (TIGR04255 family)
LLWKEFKEEFPLVEEHSPLDPAFERFAIPTKAKRPKLQFKMFDAPPTPRCWFLNQDQTKLIQIQPDRFIHNWRKRQGDEEYPRYKVLKETLKAKLETFQTFLEREDLGTLSPNQCEVTYVNHVVLPEEKKHGHLNEILAPVSLQHSDSFLSSTEESRVTLRYVIKDDEGKPIGRLHIEAEPAYRISDGLPMYVLTLTARGAPLGPSVEDALKFLDIGREWVVRGFAAVTTAEMHEEWGRKP